MIHICKSGFSIQILNEVITKWVMYTLNEPIIFIWYIIVSYFLVLSYLCNQISKKLIVFIIFLLILCYNNNQLFKEETL